MNLPEVAYLCYGKTYLYSNTYFINKEKPIQTVLHGDINTKPLIQ